MNRNNYIYIFLVLISSLVYSCKTLKISKKEDLLARTTTEIIKEKLKSVNYPENLFIQNINLKISGENQSSIRLNVFIKKDELIFLSGRYMGFEIFRFMVDRDSVKFINRFQRTYYYDDAKSFFNKYGLGGELIDIQDFIYTGFLYSKGLDNKVIRSKFLRNSDSIQYNYPIEEGKKLNFNYNLLGQLKNINFYDYTNDLFLMMNLEREGSDLNYISGDYIKSGNKINWSMDINEVQYKEYKNLDFRIGNNYYEIQNIL
jgi:hypothetical protein